MGPGGEYVWSEEEGFLEEYRAMADQVRTDEDMKLHQENVKALLGLLDEKQYGLLKADLYRESGEFEKCIELLKKYWTYDKYESRIIEQLMRKAYEENDRLFRLDEE